MGGLFTRKEYLVIGDGMKQACISETHATEGGQTICSNVVHNFVKSCYNFKATEGGGHGEPSDETFYLVERKENDNGNTKVTNKADAFILRTQFDKNKLNEPSVISTLQSFVPNAINLHLKIDQEFWAKELRMITVMFILLGVDLSDTEDQKGMERVQDITKTIQKCVYRTRGSLNKFLMDDKGSVMLMCWGLPPYSSIDDHLGSVLTGFELIRELKKYNCPAYIGISTGTAFSGVCGTIGNRKEYSLLGEKVNLSARNMQKAIEINKKRGSKYGMLICEKTAEVNLSLFIYYFINFSVY